MKQRLYHAIPLLKHFNGSQWNSKEIKFLKSSFKLLFMPRFHFNQYLNIYNIMFYIILCTYLQTCNIM